MDFFLNWRTNRSWLKYVTIVLGTCSPNTIYFLYKLLTLLQYLCHLDHNFLHVLLNAPLNYLCFSLHKLLSPSNLEINSNFLKNYNFWNVNVNSIKKFIQSNIKYACSPPRQQKWQKSCSHWARTKWCSLCWADNDRTCAAHEHVWSVCLCSVVLSTSVARWKFQKSSNFQKKKKNPHTSNMGIKCKVFSSRTQN